MKKGNMEVKEVVEVKDIKKIKISVNYLDFVNKVIVEKLENLNSEKLRELYSDIVKLKFSNIERVSNRCLREKLSGILEVELKSRNIDFKEYKRINDVLVNKIKEDKKGNYISL